MRDYRQGKVLQLRIITVHADDNVEAISALNTGKLNDDDFVKSYTKKYYDAAYVKELHDEDFLERFAASNTGGGTKGIFYGGQNRLGYTHEVIRYEIVGDKVNFKQLLRENVGQVDTIKNGAGIAGDEREGVFFGGHQASSVYGEAYHYKTVGDIVTLTVLTQTGTAPSGRYNMVMLGNAKKGVVWGGATGNAVVNDWFRYEVTGTNMRWYPLTKAGSTISGRFSASAVGNATAGLVCVWSNI